MSLEKKNISTLISIVEIRSYKKVFDGRQGIDEENTEHTCQSCQPVTPNYTV